MLNIMTIWNPNSQFNWLTNEDVVNTVILILIVFILRTLIIRTITVKRKVLSDTRRRWVSIVQNSSILLAGLGLIFIWSPELSTFALSLTAFVVALVIATKEYILCMIGAVYRATSRPFTVGDWIEIQGMRGEVIIEGILTTKLQEVGTGSFRFHYTGRVLTFPNSILLTQTVFNETFRKRFLHHRFTVTIEPGIDPTKIFDGVVPLIKKNLADTDKVADRYWSMVQQRSQTALPSRDPQVSLGTTDIGKISFSMMKKCLKFPDSCFANCESQKTPKAVAPSSPQSLSSFPPSSSKLPSSVPPSSL